jgi:hypothetical protein
MPDYVDIAFDCVPLRTVAQLRPPLDASPEVRQRCERIAAAIAQFGISRTYWIENAHCTFRLANSEVSGMVRFEVSGLIRTDPSDAKTEHLELDVKLAGETCGGVPDAARSWLTTQVERAIAVEFDRFLAAGRPSGEAEPPRQHPPDDPGL